VPVLQLHGERDPWIPPPTSDQLTPWTTGPTRFEIVPSAGHFLPEEACDLVNRVLLDWLGSLPKGADPSLNGHRPPGPPP
jgi:pimeloyl-ACP methyl ester carboxylesterase